MIFSIQSRYSLSDPKAQSIVRLITESVQVENLRFLFNLPWTRHLFPEGTIQYYVIIGLGGWVQKMVIFACC